MRESKKIKWNGKALIGEQIIVTYIANCEIETITREKQIERNVTTKRRKYSPTTRVVY